MISKCNFCGKEYLGRTRKRNLLNHIKHCSQNINSEKYECKCGKKYVNRHSFIGHASLCGKKKKECGKCGKLFYRLGRHICNKNKKQYKRVDPKCQFCGKFFENGKALGGHKTMCTLNPNKTQTKINISTSLIGKKLSQKTKNKISASRTKFLIDNPDKVPYLLNHSSKMSYPESIFKNALESSGIIGWKYNYQHGIYQYDFAFLDQKIDVEIDGGTHQSKKVKKIDERRDKFSKDLGWIVIRFTAKEVKENVIACIEKLKKYLNGK